MAINTRGLPFAKPEPRIVKKKEKQLAAAAQERACRLAVKKRDQGRCRVPGCRESGLHLHHIIYRSRGGKWTTANCCLLCAIHHQLLHNGLIEVRGNADEELIIEGERKWLAFTL